MKWHHAGIYVRSLAEAAHVFEYGLGYHPAFCMRWEDEKILFLERDGTYLELIESASTDPGTMHAGFEVNDASEWTVRFCKAGILPLEGPFDLDNGWKSMFFQAGTLVIELIESKKPV